MVADGLAIAYLVVLVFAGGALAGRQEPVEPSGLGFFVFWALVVGIVLAVWTLVT